MKKILIAGLVLLGAFGCSKTEQSVAVSGEAQNSDTQLPNNAPVIKAVTSGQLAPFSLLDETGTIQGIDVDIIRAIAEDQGFQVELYHEPITQIFSTLEKGTYDVLIDDRSLTPERAAKYGYTNAYFKNPSVVMYNPKVPVNTINDLKNLRVATMIDTKQNDTVNAVNPVVHDQLDSPYLMYQGLAQGKYDAILQDKYLLAYINDSHINNSRVDYGFKMLEYEPDTEPSINLVMYTQKDNNELVAKLNSGIENLQKSGKIDTIVKKYIKTSGEQ